MSVGEIPVFAGECHELSHYVETGRVDLTIALHTNMFGVSNVVDMKKRDALKVLGGTAVIASVPSLASAKAGLFGASSEGDVSFGDSIVGVGADSDLSIALSVGTDSAVTLTNNTEEAMVVRHVHPGIVHAGDKTFDLNSVFQGKAHTIEAGASVTFSVVPTHATQRETLFPRHRYSNVAHRVAVLTGTDSQGVVASSSRSFYS